MLPTLEDKKEDPRITRTRNLLEQAFMALIAEKSFESLSVQEITDHAGINRATFYAHFPDKYALLDHTTHIQFTQELEQRTLNVCTFSIENLHALIVTVCEFTQQASSHCNVGSTQFEAIMEAQIVAQIEELIENWVVKMQSEGALTHPVDAHHASVASSWAIYGLALHWRKEKTHPPAAEFATEVLPMILTNLGVGQPV